MSEDRSNLTQGEEVLSTSATPASKQFCRVGCCVPGAAIVETLLQSALEQARTGRGFQPPFFRDTPHTYTSAHLPPPWAVLPQRQR